MRFGVLRVAHFEAPLIYKPAIQTTIKTQKTQKEDQKAVTATTEQALRRNPFPRSVSISGIVDPHGEEQGSTRYDAWLAAPPGISLPYGSCKPTTLSWEWAA